MRNQDETAVDCGGRCDACPPPAPTCDDGVRNGTEPSVDCGNAACGLCALGRPCDASAQCVTGLCQAGSCRPASCGDGQRSGTETDVDCGGACGPCPGQLCGTDTACASGVCEDGRCCGGTLADCTRCARRLVTGISCDTNGPEASNDCNAFLQCLADNSEVCTRRFAPGCSEENPEGVCSHTSFGGNAGPGVVLADAILGSAQCIF